MHIFKNQLFLPLFQKTKPETEKKAECFHEDQEGKKIFANFLQLYKSFNCPLFTSLIQQVYSRGMFKPFISKQGEEAILGFRYKGGSAAYSYDYLWSPLAEFILRHFIPKTWAPNAITVTGLMFSVAGCSLLAFQHPGSPLIPLCLLVMAVFNFIYQTLDNIDGKQARRTGSSTPLGMMMDHGCDALGLPFIILGVAGICLVRDEATILYTGQAGVLFGFWTSVWAQYHSKGIMILGKVNAVDDGIPTISVLALASFFFGQDFWVAPLYGQITAQWLLANGIRVSGVLQIFSLISNAGQNFTKDYLHAFSHLIHMLMITASLYTIITFTDWHHQYFYLVYFCMAFTMVRDISYMHLCVVTGEKYQQFQFTTLAFCFGFPVYIFLKEYFGFAIWDDSVFLYGMLMLFSCNYFNFVFCAAQEIASILKIDIFSIKPKTD